MKAYLSFGKVTVKNELVRVGPLRRGKQMNMVRNGDLKERTGHFKSVGVEPWEFVFGMANVSSIDILASGAGSMSIAEVDAI
jgi:hypothetical protein